MRFWGWHLISTRNFASSVTATPGQGRHNRGTGQNVKHLVNDDNLNLKREVFMHGFRLKAFVSLICITWMVMTADAFADHSVMDFPSKLVTDELSQMLPGMCPNDILIIQSLYEDTAKSQADSWSRMEYEVEAGIFAVVIAMRGHLDGVYIKRASGVIQHFAFDTIAESPCDSAKAFLKRPVPDIRDGLELLQLCDCPNPVFSIYDNRSHGGW